jgi:hypothetical protein
MDRRVRGVVAAIRRRNFYAEPDPGFFLNAGQIQQKKGCLSFICSHLEPGFRLMNLADPDTSKTI